MELFSEKVLHQQKMTTLSALLKLLRTPVDKIPRRDDVVYHRNTLWDKPLCENGNIYRLREFELYTAAIEYLKLMTDNFMFDKPEFRQALQEFTARVDEFQQLTEVAVVATESMFTPIELELSAVSTISKYNFYDWSVTGKVDEVEAALQQIDNYLDQLEGIYCRGGDALLSIHNLTVVGVYYGIMQRFPTVSLFSSELGKMIFVCLERARKLPATERERLIGVTKEYPELFDEKVVKLI